MPAVSTSSSLRPSICSGRSIALRVAGRSRRRSRRPSPGKRLTKRGLADVRAADHGEPDQALGSPLVVLGQQVDEAVEQVAVLSPWAAETAHRLAEAEPVLLERRAACRRTLSILFAATTDGNPPAPEEVGAACRRRAAGRPWRRRRTSATAALARARRAPGRGSSRRSGRGPRCPSRRCRTPARRRPFHSVAISLRSRVIPARSWTTASREFVPRPRPRSEDLPTFRISDDRTLNRDAPFAPGAHHDPVGDIVDAQAGGVDVQRVVGGAGSGGTARGWESRSSRLVPLAQHRPAVMPSSRRGDGRARRSAERKTFTLGVGARRRCRCRGPRGRSRRRATARAAGRRAVAPPGAATTREATLRDLGERMASVTSSPSSVT